MSIVEMLHVQPLLSYSGAANAPEIDIEPDFGPAIGPSIGPAIGGPDLTFGGLLNIPGLEWML